MPLGRKPTPRRRRTLLAAQAAGLVGFYYVVPVHAGESTARLWLRGIAAAVLLGLVLGVVVRAVLRQVRADDDDVQIERLALAAVTGVICFALTDYVIAR